MTILRNLAIVVIAVIGFTVPINGAGWAKPVIALEYTIDAEDAQRELAQRYIERDGLPRLNLQGPLVAILGLLALGIGYGMGALSDARHLRTRAPRKPCRDARANRENRKD